MARRRPTPRPLEEDSLHVPPELRRCVVEDWVDPASYDPPTHTNLNDLRDLTYWQIVAGRHRGDARARWLADAEVPRENQCQVIPFGTPRFRDKVAFERAVAARFGRSTGPQ